MEYPMPNVGSLWIWRGNQYDVLRVTGKIIYLSEIGSGNMFYQSLSDTGWKEPVGYPQ